MISPEESPSPERLVSPEGPPSTSRSTSTLPPSRIGRLKTWCSHAFAVEGPDAVFDDGERQLAEKLAEFVVRRRMTSPALMALESSLPLGFLGSQFLVFLSPFATLLFSSDEFESLTRLLEKRRGLGLVIDAIIARENSRPHG